MLSFEAFEAAVRACYDSIPEEFLRRVSGPVVVREAQPHPELPGNYLLGECIHAPDFAGTGELHSTVYLYYGSFARIAARDPDFDVEAEIRETVLHEVQHHVEDAAEASGLADEDFVGEQHERMLQGLDYVDRYWRLGRPVHGEDGSVWAVDGDLVLELELSAPAWRRAAREGLVRTFRGRRLVFEPGEIGGSEALLFAFEGHGDARDGDAGDLFVDLRPARRARNPA